jgi:hypothetical protein
MKKYYLKPSMEAVEIKNECQILAGSVTSVNSDGVFDGTITGSNEPGRAPEFQEMQDLLFGK